MARNMEWTVEDDQKLAVACASTTIHDIPDSTGLLADIFGHSDAFNRLRLQQVCKDWKGLLSSRQLTTGSLFLDFDLVLVVSRFKEKLNAIFENAYPGNGQVYVERFEREVNKMCASIGSSLLQDFKGSTLYVRIGKPFLNADPEVVVPKGDSVAIATTVRALSRVIALILKSSQARRIVFVDSILMEESLLVTEKATEGFNRPEWANSSLQEIRLVNCQINLKLLNKKEKHPRGTVKSLTVRLEKQYMPWDIMCLVRDAVDYQPDILACIEDIRRPLVTYGELFGQEEAAVIRDIVMRRFWIKTPDDIQDKTFKELDFFSLKHSSLLVLRHLADGIQAVMAGEE